MSEEDGKEEEAEFIHSNEKTGRRKMKKLFARKIIKR